MNRGRGRTPRIAAQALVGERPERHEHPGVEQRQLALEVRPAGVALVDGRLVRRRRAPHGRGDPRAREAEPVVASDARRLVGEPGAVQGGVEEVAGAVAGEHPTGPVGPVGGRGQADDHHRGIGITEGRDRPAPVLLVAERGALLDRDLLAPGHQTGARDALDDLGLDLSQGARTGRIHGRQR